MKARGLLRLAVALLLPIGCASAQLGNFTAHSPDVDSALARDALRQLVALYPPAQTRFSFAQPLSDPFGDALLSGLREAGYAIVEEPKPAAIWKVLGKPLPPVESGPAEPSLAIPLSYVVDESEELCRIMLRVGPQALSRPYNLEGTAPLGHWMRQED